jgi:hypothetical protein
MANTTSFTVEGPMTLAYFSDELHSKRVLINPQDEEDKSHLVSEVPSCDCTEGESLETKIAREIGFPNDAEFDEFYRKMDELRQQGLRTEEGVPDVTRPVKLRITVEVL